MNGPGPAVDVLRAASQLGGTPLIDNHEPSLWLRGKLAELHLRLHTAGAYQACEHLTGASVGVVALWRPDYVACAACARSALQLTGDADRTCDRCGCISETIHGELAGTGNVLIAFGLCPACHEREVGS